MKSTFVAAKPGERAPSRRSGQSPLTGPNSRLTGFSEYESGMRVPVYERVGEPKKEHVEFSRLVHTWYDLKGFTPKTGPKEFGKLTRANKAWRLIEDGTPLLKRELSAAGVNVEAILAGQTLSELRGGKEVIHLTAPSGIPLFGAKKQTAPAKTNFAHVADLEARALLDRLHPNGLPPMPKAPAPAKAAAPTKTMTFAEQCIAAGQAKAAQRQKNP